MSNGACDQLWLRLKTQSKPFCLSSICRNFLIITHKKTHTPKYSSISNSLLINHWSRFFVLLLFWGFVERVPHRNISQIWCVFFLSRCCCCILLLLLCLSCSFHYYKCAERIGVLGWWCYLCNWPFIVQRNPFLMSGYLFNFNK